MYARAVLLAVTLLLSNTVWSLAVTETGDYTDSLSFFDPPWNSTDLGSLGPGSNFVVGSLQGECQESAFAPEGKTSCNPDYGGDTQDSFLFHLGVGQLIEHIYVTSSNFVGPDGFDWGVGGTERRLFDYANGMFNFLFDGVLLPNSVSADLVPAATRGFGAGLYGFAVNGGYADQAGPYQLDWAMEIVVADVPAPDTLLLIVLALCVLGVSLRQGSTFALTARFWQTAAGSSMR